MIEKKKNVLILVGVCLAVTLTNFLPKVLWMLGPWYIYGAILLAFVACVLFMAVDLMKGPELLEWLLLFVSLVGSLSLIQGALAWIIQVINGSMWESSLKGGAMILDIFLLVVAVYLLGTGFHKGEEES